MLDSIQSRYYPDVRAVLLAASGEEYRKYMGREVTPGDIPQFNSGPNFDRPGYEGEAEGYRPGVGPPSRFMRGRGGSSGYGASASDEAMGDADATPTTGLKSDAVRGYIVTIRGTTPNKAKESFV